MNLRTLRFETVHAIRNCKLYPTLANHSRIRTRRPVRERTGYFGTKQTTQQLQSHSRDARDKQTGIVRRIHYEVLARSTVLCENEYWGTEEEKTDERPQSGFRCRE